MQQSLADPTFGLDRQAWSILDALSTMEPDFADFNQEAQLYDICIQTSVYVRGTSRWVALTLYPQLEPSGISKVLVFGEDAVDDSVCVENWFPSRRDTAPSPRDDHTFTSHRFRWDEGEETLNFIWTQLAIGYRSMRVSRGILRNLEV